MVLASLGLGGDGDEVDAIASAFRAISVPVPEDDASRWVSVGDVWASARKFAPGLTADQLAWEAFRRAIAVETGVDWQAVVPETILLAPGIASSTRVRWRAIVERLKRHA